MSTALVLILHGSRHPDATNLHGDLLREVQKRHPDYDVSIGYIEHSEPPMSDVLAAAADMHSDVIVLPFLLFAAGHAKSDIPEAITEAQSNHPNTMFHYKSVIGVDDRMVRLVRDRIDACGTIMEPDTSVIVVGRGASDPEALDGFKQIAERLRQRHEFHTVDAAFYAIASPSVDDVLALVALAKPTRLVVMPYFLFTGVLLDKLQDRIDQFANENPDIITSLAAPLGIPSTIYDIIADRIQ